MFWRRRNPRDFHPEIGSPLQLEADRLAEQGLAREEALLSARRVFGNATTYRSNSTNPAAGVS